MLKEPDIAELRKHLGRAPTLIVAYLRDPAGVLPSKYNQLTKKGINVSDFDEFYNRHASRIFELALRMDRWADVFGWENLRIRTLDSRCLTGGNLIEDLLSALGMSLAELGGRAAAGMAPQNVSLGWKTTEVLRALYARVRSEVERETFNSQRIKRDVGSVLRNSCIQMMQDLELDSERAQYLTSQQQRECAAVFSREILKLNEKIVGPKLPLPEVQTIGERPFLPAIEQVPPDQRAEMGRRLAELLQLESDGGDDGSSSKLRRSTRRKEKFVRLKLSEDLRRSLVRTVLGPDSRSERVPPKSHFADARETSTAD
jgi:hypothetical protein